ncbi:energy transducer TonB [uncultured Lutibacter sp.]|uniref:energy transducer TonB n=1 Tax=uncultured Lutibacter sp. TaxID=437739 RepID=UPI002623C212|nr:energy transducer TonB [uncultured Lutibacter sp.]
MRTTSILLFLVFIALNLNAQNTITGTDDYAEINSNESIELVKKSYSQPEFPGGNKELVTYLSKNIRYPRNSRIASTRGKVLVSFNVEKDGKITNTEVIKGVNLILNKEAKRVVSNMPNWKPALLDGLPVRELLTIPIVFFRN